MSYFKFKIIFINIALFFLVCAQAHECREYFRKSDFAQSYFLSMEEFRALEDLANLEISAFYIENVVLRNNSLEEARTKLAELLQTGVPMESY